MLPYLGLKSRTSFIENAADIIRNFLSFNQLGYLQSLSFEHHMEKYKFWNELYHKPITNKSDYEIKTQVQSV